VAAWLAAWRRAWRGRRSIIRQHINEWQRIVIGCSNAQLAWRSAPAARGNRLAAQMIASPLHAHGAASSLPLQRAVLIAPARSTHAHIMAWLHGASSA